MEIKKVYVFKNKKGEYKTIENVIVEGVFLLDCIGILNVRYINDSCDYLVNIGKMPLPNDIIMPEAQEITVVPVISFVRLSDMAPNR